MDILDRDLSPEEEKVLREYLNAWKEEVYAQLMEEVDELKEQKIEELEQQSIGYKEELKEEATNKMLTALSEMKEELRAELLSEMLDTNPEIKILEKIKELIAPTIDENYIANTYSQELITLREENEKLKNEVSLEEGARTLANLLKPYSDTTRKLLLSLINEGDADSVTEQFYSIIENLEEACKTDKKKKNYEGDTKDDEEEMDDDEIDDEEEEDSEDDEEDSEEDDSKKDKKKKKKAKKSKKEKEEPTDGGSEEDVEESYNSYTDTDEKKTLNENVKVNTLRNSIKRLA